MTRKIYTPPARYTADDLAVAARADLLADAEHAEQQAADGPFFPERGWSMDLFINEPCVRCVEVALRRGVTLPQPLKHAPGDPDLDFAGLVADGTRRRASNPKGWSIMTRDRRPTSHTVTAPPVAPGPIKLSGPHGTCMDCGGDMAIRFRGEFPARCLSCGRAEHPLLEGENLE